MAEPIFDLGTPPDQMTVQQLMLYLDVLAFLDETLNIARRGTTSPNDHAPRIPFERTRAIPLLHERYGLDFFHDDFAFTLQTLDPKFRFFDLMALGCFSLLTDNEGCDDVPVLSVKTFVGTSSYTSFVSLGRHGTIIGRALMAIANDIAKGELTQEDFVNPSLIKKHNGGKDG
ncbi:MAG: hypothetical protein ABIG71_03410 [Candidatus Uhrbacteria bacterium]